MECRNCDYYKARNCKHQCLDLPSGTTCADCVHVETCTKIFGIKPENTSCGFEPVRFKRKVVESMKYENDIVQSLCTIPATDVNFVADLKRATPNQLRLAIGRMESREGRDKGRITACKRELKRRTSQKKQTNSERIRSMSDEELAKFLMSTCKDEFVSGFCGKSPINKKCEESLDKDPIPDELCEKCCVEWLQKEVE